MVLVLLTSLNCYLIVMCLHSVSCTTLFFWHPHAENPTIQLQDSWLSHLLLLWIHTGNSLTQDLRHCSTLSFSKAKLKTILFSQYFCPSWYQYPVSATVVCVCVCACMIQISVIHIWIHCGVFFFGGGRGCLSFYMVLCVGCSGETVLYVCIEYHI